MVGWEERGRILAYNAGQSLPATLCRVMAEEYVAFYKQTAEEGFDPLPAGADVLLQALASWDPYMADSCATMMMQDYHANRPKG